MKRKHQVAEELPEESLDEENGEEEEFYYISNPALGLWAVSSRFKDDSGESSPTNVKRGEANAAVASKQEASDMSGGVGGWKRPPCPTKLSSI